MKGGVTNEQRVEGSYWWAMDGGRLCLGKKEYWYTEVIANGYTKVMCDILELSISVVLQLMTQFVTSTLLCLLTCSPFAPRNLPTHKSHKLSCDQMLLCDWAALYRAAEQLVVTRVPRPLPSIAEVGVAMRDYTKSKSNRPTRCGKWCMDIPHPINMISFLHGRSGSKAIRS